MNEKESNKDSFDEPLGLRDKGTSHILNLETLTEEKVASALDEATLAKTRLDNLADEITNSRNKNLETLAIFVALFTFASLSFQMFANVNKAFWVPLGLILLGGLTLFCSILIGVSSLKIDESWRRKVMPIICGIISLTLIALGALFYRNALSKYDGEINQCIHLAESILSKDANQTQQNASFYNLVCKELRQ